MMVNLTKVTYLSMILSMLGGVRAVCMRPEALDIKYMVAVAFGAEVTPESSQQRMHVT